jgi:rubredoxin
MPRYLFDFECRVCGNIYEDLVDTRAESLATPHCPACYSKETFRRVPVPRVIGNKSDFDLLNKRPPDPPIFSGPHTRSK